MSKFAIANRGFKIRTYTPGNLSLDVNEINISRAVTLHVIKGIIMTDMENENSLLPTGAMLPWWLVLLQGIIALALGCAFLAWPYFTLMFAVIFIGAYWFFSGIFGLISLAVDRTNVAWKLVLGLLGIIAGILILIYPLYSTLLLPALLVIFIAVWGLIIGAITILHGTRGGGWGEIILGLLGILFGIVLLVNPLLDVLLLPYLLGALGIIFGIAAIITAFMKRGK